MAKTKADEAGVSVLEAAPKAAFYWCGLLPAPGDVTVLMPSKTSLDMEEVKFSAYDLWNGRLDPRDPSIQIFAAKARQYNGLTVRGFHFHASSQSAIGKGNQIDRNDYPGQVAWMRPEQAEKVIKACFRTFIRWKHGVGRMNHPSAKTYEVDMDFDTRPAGMTDAEFSRYDANVNALSQAREEAIFNPATDKLVSEFVYVVKLDYDRRKLDEEAYERNPNRFHAQMVPPFNRDFFENPPKSVAEMYPQEKA